MDVAAGTQWGSSWGMERACGRGGIRKSCGKVFDERRKIIEEESKTTPFENPNPKGAPPGAGRVAFAGCNVAQRIWRY